MLDEFTAPSLRAKVLFSRSFPELESVSHASLAALSEAASIRLFEEGHKLVHGERPVSNVYVLLDGELHLRRRDKGVSKVSPPALVGFIEAIAGDEANLEVTATSPASVLQIPASAIRHQMQHDFSLVRSTLRLLSRRLLDRTGSLPILDEAVFGLRTGVWREHELTTAEKLLQLRATDWGKGANLDAIGEMATNIREVRFPTGAFLWQRGDPADRWYRIDCGTVQCESAEGDTVEVPAGHVLGMIDAHADMGRRYAARAIAPVIALQIQLTDLHAVLEAHTPLAARMTSLLARHLL
jgi:CRP-like cAMP-binding protein